MTCGPLTPELTAATLTLPDYGRVAGNSGAIAEYSPIRCPKFNHITTVTPFLLTTEIPYMGGAWLIDR